MGLAGGAPPRFFRALLTRPRVWVWAFSEFALHSFYRVEVVGGEHLRAAVAAAAASASSSSSSSSTAAPRVHAQAQDSTAAERQTTATTADDSGLGPGGGVLVVCSHPGAMFDPPLVRSGVLRASRRRARFVAKSTFWPDAPGAPRTNRGFGEIAVGPIIRGSGSIPIYRTLDLADTQGEAEAAAAAELNRAALAAVDYVLSHGEVVVVFPEGESRADSRIRPLKTGTARMALSAAARTRTAWGAHAVPISIVPAGIFYEDAAAWRSRATVAFGASFAVDDDALLTQWVHDPRGAAAVLTAQIAERMRAQAVECDPHTQLPVCRRLEALYSHARGLDDLPRSRLRRLQFIARGIVCLDEHDRAHLADLVAMLDELDRQLAALGLTFRHLRAFLAAAPAPRAAAMRLVLREAAIQPVAAPLAVAWLVAFALPNWATAALARRISPDPESLAIYKSLGGIVVWLGWIAACTAAAAAATGTAAAAGATALGLGALVPAGLWAFRHDARVFREARAVLVLLRASEEQRRAVFDEHLAIAAAMDEIRVWMDADGDVSQTPRRSQQESVGGSSELGES